MVMPPNCRWVMDGTTEERAGAYRRQRRPAAPRHPAKSPPLAPEAAAGKAPFLLSRRAATPCGPAGEQDAQRTGGV